MITYTVNVSDCGNRFWYNQEGQFHREDGPSIEYTDGTTYWHRNGELHREDGPALDFSNGNKYWHQNGKFHREDGPAVEYADGHREWYLNGIQLTEEEFNIRTKSKELTVKEIEQLLGYRIKIVGNT